MKTDHSVRLQAVPRTEFIVVGIVPGESNQLRVIGRCGPEPIRLGGRFEAIFRYGPREVPGDLGRASERIEERSVSLDVESIHSYERSLDQLGPSMAGSLSLTGQGAEYVAEG